MKSKKTLFFIMVLPLLLIYILSNNYTRGIGNSREDKQMNRKIPVSYIYNANPFYVHWRKHFCPKCGTRLKTAYDSVIVNSNSPEANNYDFSIAAGDSYLTGDVEFRTSYFKCPKCDFSIPFNEMKKLEKKR